MKTNSFWLQTLIMYKKLSGGAFYDHVFVETSNWRRQPYVFQLLEFLAIKQAKSWSYDRTVLFAQATLFLNLFLLIKHRSLKKVLNPIEKPFGKSRYVGLEKWVSREV